MGMENGQWLQVFFIHTTVADGAEVEGCTGRPVREVNRSRKF